MRIFITGIDGFLGATLYYHLTECGHIVAGNDSHICNTGLTRIVEPWHSLDCTNFIGMEHAFRMFEPEVLVHCAATAHEGLSSFSPSFVTRNIFDASVATFSAAIAAGIKRIVYMSSMSRYGRGPFGPPFIETMTPMPVDPYGIAKVAAEQVLCVLCETHDVKWCCLVPHNIIGPGQKYDDPYRNVASIMINRALQGMPIIIYGNGSQTRSFSPIADCLPSIKAAIDGAADGETVNIGPDSGAISILRLANMIDDLVGDAGIEFAPPRPNEVAHAWCTSDKARNLLGYREKQSLHECLVDMVEFIERHGPKSFQHFAPIEIASKSLPASWNAQSSRIRAPV
jgi:UDP-glucose 4-epimerase